MPKPRNKAHHLMAARRAHEAVNEGQRRVCIQVVLARKAGATWAEIAEATGEDSRQAAQQKCGRWDSDGTNLWRQDVLT